MKNVLNKEKKRTKKLKRYNIDNYSTMSYIKKDNKYEKTFIEKNTQWFVIEILRTHLAGTGVMLLRITGASELGRQGGHVPTHFFS